MSICVFLLIALATPARAGEVDFNRDIRPLLTENCFQCHGPDAETREADLRLDMEEAAKADRGGYAVVLPGQPEASELIRRVSSSEPWEKMPPEDSESELSAEQIDLLTQWVAEGAEWSPPWAYVSPRKFAAPPVQDSDWCRNWIDRFVLHRLESEGYAPAAEADPVTLIRRLAFDLTGLPPAPEMVERFAADPSDETYSSIVQDLLASPHFGERMAIYWLDLVRFADTVGYHGDQTHRIWPYRDYVIHAFNNNTPFDQFTREQLAGDLLPEPTVDQRIATGYNRLLQTSHEGGVQLKEYRAIYLADRVRNVSQVWMGATVGCAQCHDHKYDPYTARDFYSLGAFFADIDDEAHLQGDDVFSGNKLPTPRPPEIEVLSVYQRERLTELEEQLTSAKRAGETDSVADLEQAIQQIKKHQPKTMVTQAIEPRLVRLLPRGNWLDEFGPIVEPAVPEFLGEVKTSAPRATRLDFANWLTDEENGVGGLTARVMANRFWYLLFGEGLSRVLDDFGGQGEPPSHPQLLDRLAIEYLENNWDTKHMIQLIVTSSAYRQSSRASEQLMEHDPLNRLVGRQARFRLPAEMVRDTALDVSGLLDETVGGPSVKPYQPEGYYQHLNFPARSYQADTDTKLWRRSLYIHWQRQFLHPTLKALDAPSREECTAQRQRSNTALASLTLLNDPIFVEAARCFAERILLSELPEDFAKLDQAFRWAISREPTEAERDVLLTLLEESRDFYAASPADAERLFQVGESVPDPALPKGELASWTMVARTILNLAETTTRN